MIKIKNSYLLEWPKGEKHLIVLAENGKIYKTSLRFIDFELEAIASFMFDNFDQVLSDAKPITSKPKTVSTENVIVKTEYAPFSIYNFPKRRYISIEAMWENYADGYSHALKIETDAKGNEFYTLEDKKPAGK